MIEPGATQSLTPVAQDYLKVIWSAQEWTDRPVTTKALAARLGVGTSTVSETVRRLVEAGLVSHEPYGAVGLTEAEARHRYKSVDIYKAAFRPMKETFYGGQHRTLMKLVVDGESQKIVGCHICGDDGPEMIQLAAVAIKMGVTKQQWDLTTALHPTAAEELVTMREKYVPPELGVGG